MLNYKEKRILIVLAIFVVFLFPTAQAAANPFVDVPAKHWSYDAPNKQASDKVTEDNHDPGFSPDLTMTRDESAALIAKLNGIGNSIKNRYSQGQINNNLNLIKDTGKGTDRPSSIAATPTKTSDSDILVAALLASNEVRELPSGTGGFWGGGVSPEEGSGSDNIILGAGELPPPTIQQSPITVPPSDQLLAQLKVELAEMPGVTSCTGGPDCYANSGDSSDGSNVAQPITDAPPRHGW